jgi:4-hydroxyphenylpyruvate dioxygenase
MKTFKIQNQGFDHVEFILNDINAHAATYQRMGFEKAGERHLPKKGLKSVLWQQGFVRILLTQSDGTAAAEKEEAVRFLRNHAEGVCVLGVEVDDAKAAFAETTANGARPARAPETFETPEGQVTLSEIWTPADVRYRFITRKASGGLKAPALFEEGLITSRLESPSPLNIRVIDHLTNNVEMGQMKKWVEWYKQVFGFIVTRSFNIRASQTGLISDVVESPCGKVKVPINEGSEATSQVQEFCNRLRGAGVQHLALLTTDLIDTLKGLRKQDFKFLTVPHTYYEAVPTRVPGVTENLKELEELGILLDGDNTGYLLQIFGQEILGPFFFEYIQRKGNRGFGEGNFKALFEAIERDQVRRGVLPAKS